MSEPKTGLNLAAEPDFALGSMRVSPSACRVEVDGQASKVEAKTMAVLVTLARACGGTVSRDALIAACWEGRIVSDDAIARAIAKVRALSVGRELGPFTLETVPKVGYRLVAAETPADRTASVANSPAMAAPDGPNQPALQPWNQPPPADANVPSASMAPPAMIPVRVAAAAAPNLAKRVTGIAVAAALAAGAPFAGALLKQTERGDASAPQTETAAVVETSPRALAPPSGMRAEDVLEALHNLDERRLRAYLDAGWDPMWTFDSQLNTALHRLMEACERDPSGHDPEAVVRIAEMLVAAGADPNAKNKWEDTPLRIARADRYCKADHPVVTYLTSLEAAAGAPPRPPG